MRHKIKFMGLYFELNKKKLKDLAYMHTVFYFFMHASAANCILAGSYVHTL